MISLALSLSAILRANDFGDWGAWKALDKGVEVRVARDDFNEIAGAYTWRVEFRNVNANRSVSVFPYFYLKNQKTGRYEIRKDDPMWDYAFRLKPMQHYTAAPFYPDKDMIKFEWKIEYDNFGN